MEPVAEPIIRDRVSDAAPGAREIGFTLPETYNASEILFHNLEAGRGDKTAVYSPGGDATYAGLCARAAQIGNALGALGLERGERVLLFLNDTATYPAALFGAIRAGCVPVLVNTLSSGDLVQFYLEDSGARAAVVDAEHAALFDLDAAARSVTRFETLITTSGAAPGSGALRCIDGETWFATFPAHLEAAPTGRDDMAFWMYSSGSTGRPKGIVHLQHDMRYVAESYARHVLHIGDDDICFSVPKIFFAYGLGNSVIFPFAVGGSAVLYPGRPAPGPVFECVQRYRPTLFFGLPTLYNALVNDRAIDQADFSSVRLCVSAAEVLSADLFGAWKERFGLEIVEGLGSTEVLHIYLSNDEGHKRLGSAGRRVPGYELALTDRDGAPVTDGGEGILWVRGQSTAPCYWQRPDKTAETMRGDWLWTGDRFARDADGFYFFRGRADDLIKVSGQWVYPLEIELCLNEHPTVLECAVLGVELADRRMTLRAFVVPEPGVAPGEALTKTLQDYVKQTLLPYKYPREVVYRERLPKTGTGKIDRQALLRSREEPR